MKHLGPLALFAALAAAWTWPLARHLGDAIPGNPGDNYSFIWNLWWMRHVLATPGLGYFQTNYIFYPFGTNLVNSSHTALPALIAATVFGRASTVTAQNLLLLLYVFANMATAYALAWSVTRHRRGAVLAGIVFGLSPYLAAHLPGHFELMAAWVLPAFALLLVRALRAPSFGAAAAAGLALTAGAYTVYYYVVYCLFFALVYVLAWSGAFAVTWSPRPRTRLVRRLQWLCACGAAIAAATALFIGTTGGGVVAAGPLTISATAPQNALSIMWACAIAWAASRWRPAVAIDGAGLGRLRRALAPIAIALAVFAVGVTPLLWQTARVVRRGDYVSPAYQWRSAPRGIDLLAPLLGPPRHPLTEAISGRAYAFAQLDAVEAIGWMGIVPLLMVLFVRPRAELQRDEQIWRAVALSFGVWALGPFLTVAGYDSGLRLPAILLRYVPIVANARMPGRAMLGVFMALAVLLAMRMSGAGRRLRPAAVQWLVIGLVAFEYFDAPIALTALDAPAVYQALAREGAGAVCEVPFGIGDGLSGGVGSQDRRILYYATLHEHPLAGGYVGRMPADAADRYAKLPVTAPLLRLSDGAGSAYLPRGEPPCRYLVVNRRASSRALLAYVATLRATRIASDEARDLFRLP
jgi:hypothetical protein